jgi:hypothetical protein
MFHQAELAKRVLLLPTVHLTELAKHVLRVGRWCNREWLLATYQILQGGLVAGTLRHVALCGLRRKSHASRLCGKSSWRHAPAEATASRRLLSQSLSLGLGGRLRRLRFGWRLREPDRSLICGWSVSPKVERHRKAVDREMPRH